ncbi:LysM peptidoglycan-binding domain-containing protein, partial [Enterococcus mundtii]|nr:LysM peptidoglycan-binding domain-containing protein [Enterococcus mundtii]
APTTGSDTNQGSQAVTPPVTGDSGSAGGGNTVTPPATGDNGSTGGGNTVTPPATGDNGSTGGGNTVTPPTGGDNGSTGGGNETTPEQPKPEEPTRVTPLGNSGMEFNTIDEANEWGMAELMNPDSVWKEYTGFVTKPLMWSDGLVRSYSVDFYN